MYLIYVFNLYINPFLTEVDIILKNVENKESKCPLLSDLNL